MINEGNSTIADLILDLSLASASPIGITGQDLFRGTASTQALAYRTAKMSKHQLKEFAMTIGPLLSLLTNDIHHPIACKASQGIRTLIISRTCLARFVECEGIEHIARVFDQLLSNSPDLHTVSDMRSIVENMAVMYREAAQYYDTHIVREGALRHCVRMINYGDAVIRGIACSCLAILANNLEIVRQMFVYGAVKPILNLSQNLESSEPEKLAALGCIVQLTRIPEIASKVVRQGAMPILEEGLHEFEARTAASVRNKCLFALAWLTRVPEIKERLVTEVVLSGMQRELLTDDQQNQTLVLQMMLNLRYVDSPILKQFVYDVRDRIINLMAEGLWVTRNLTTKVCVLIYSDPEQKLYFSQNGALENIFDLLNSKDLDLQEVPMVAILNFVAHPDIPWLILEKGGHHVVAKVLYAVDDTIRDLAVIILKALFLYNRDAITDCIPHDKEHLMKVDPEADPVVYGAEYGDLILEYLQRIVENRREMNYLLEGFDYSIFERENISEEEIDSFQSTFMVLDYDCNGSLELDEIKVLMVMMGEKMDEEEIVELFEEYDEDGSGELSFDEFCVMMKNWRNKFGTGAARVYKEAMERGAIGKGRRALSRWLNKDELDRKAIEKIKEKKRKAAAAKQAAMEKHMGAEKLRVQREQEFLRRQQAQEEQGNGCYDDEEYSDDNEGLPPI